MEKDNITIDGAGYSLQGSGSGTGIGLTLKTDRLGYSGVTIKNLQIKGFTTGIHFSSSSNNIISRCNITDCHYGISILSSSSNAFSGNYLHNSTIGFEFVYSPNNVLTNNHLDSNSQPLWFEGDWINSIDPSNTINSSKPIYYFVNQKDLLINPSAYPEIGYLAFVNCTRIIVKNLNYSNSVMGIVMVQTTNSTITQNNITNNWRGVYLYGSNNNSITENHVANNEDGIYVETNSANTLQEIALQITDVAFISLEQIKSFTITILSTIRRMLMPRSGTPLVLCRYLMECTSGIMTILLVAIIGAIIMGLTPTMIELAIRLIWLVNTTTTRTAIH